MDRVILIRYGELSTKKDNRKFFVRQLENNIKNKLKDIDCTIKSDNSHMYIYFSDDNFKKINNIISNTFGIWEYDICYVCESSEKDIFKTVLNTINDNKFDSFKVETRRSDKNFPLNSVEFSRKLGSFVLKNVANKHVDVHKPDLYVRVEIRHDKSYVYYNSYRGLGGYPVGVQPRSMVMLSGGIDSPVAAYLAMKRGVKIDCVYFEALPHTSLNAREKVITLTRKLCKYTDSIYLHIVPFTAIQEEIYKTSDSDYVITIMRRMMYRIMDELCKKNKALAIINGESVGQVASQTLKSMNVINKVTSTPVIRPVACLDKLEIIDISKKIDTYETSILPYEDCCTVFVPRHPVINPNLDKVLEMEEKFDYNTMIKETIDNIYTMKITEEDNSFADLL